MKKYGYEAANVRRWTLILLNLILLVGSSFPVVIYHYNGYTAWENISWIDQKQLDSEALLNLLTRVFFLMSLFGCSLQLLKLFGLLGEQRRNSRFTSIMLSEITLVGVAGVPIAEAVHFYRGNGYFNFRLFHPTSWALIAIGICVWMIILSLRLSATMPIFRSLARRNYENGIMDITMDGNTSRDEQGGSSEPDTVYEKNNIRRWLIFLLAVIMFLGLNIPVSKSDNRNIGNVAESLFSNGVAEAVISPGIGVLCLLAYLLILGGSALQVMKLMGLFGDGFRNDRGKSVILAAAQAAGIAILALGVKALLNFHDIYGIKSWLTAWSVGFYVLLALAVLQTVLACRLTWTRPVIEGPSVQPPKNQRM
ncbi:MAG: hypothetical protein J5845_08980 [Lachnospiraceae bacterium]|nr:hypothetical protein [Lachnospiraceae bacterium]